MKDITVGVLALQGDFREHIGLLKRMKVPAVQVRVPQDLDRVDGLIIPGGESTAINKLLAKYGLVQKIYEFSRSGKPIFGTCAGLIVLSKKADGKARQMGLIDIDVERNAYGRQIESFEQLISLDLDNGSGKKEFNSVFIRAPKITRKGNDVRVLGMREGEIVLARENNILVSAFHPELTDDTIIHKYFLGMIGKDPKEK